MEVVRRAEGNVLHVRVTGRLDNHWSEPFDEAIEETVALATAEHARHVIEIIEAAYIAAETARWKKVIEAANIKLE